MFSPNPFAGLVLERLFESVFPDFVLAFTFFTALCYAVLGRHFGRARPAAAMSIALGTALAVGLVWWQARAGYSMRDLGPVAVALALLALAVVVYAALQRVGGTGAGALLALAMCLLVGSTLSAPWPITPGAIATGGLVVGLIGALTLLAHHGGLKWQRAQAAPLEQVRLRHDLRDLQRDRRVAEHVDTQLRQLRTEADFLITRPDAAGDFMLQLRRLLPEEGWLTQQLARLRETAHHERAGHLARIAELRDVVQRLPPEACATAAQELAARYAQLSLDTRLDRLDRAVAEFERRIRDLTQRAEACLARHDYRPVEGLLEEAARLQAHNARLLRLIERTEQRLLSVARQIAGSGTEVSPA